jgi:soluble lytic murein transglycosylase
VESWVQQASGDRAKGLRTIRDALADRMKTALQGNGDNRATAPQASGTSDELKLLYPVYFPDSIADAGRRNGVDPLLIQSLMREESYFNEFAISTSNARGLMQLLPATASDIAHWEGMPFRTADLFKPDVNVRLGSRYLAFLHEKFNGNSMPAVGAYNGGPNAMARWVRNSPYFSSDPDMFVERIPYEQSRDYIKKVFGSYWNYQRLYGH